MKTMVMIVMVCPNTLKPNNTKIIKIRKEANEDLGCFLREETSGPSFPEGKVGYRKFCKNRKTTVFPEKRINMRKYGFKLSQEAEYDEFMRKRRNADGEKI